MPDGGVYMIAIAVSLSIGLVLGAFVPGLWLLGVALLGGMALTVLVLWLLND